MTVLELIEALTRLPADAIDRDVWMEADAGIAEVGSVERESDGSVVIVPMPYHSKD